MDCPNRALRSPKHVAEREKGWELGTGRAPYQTYDALRDTNLRQFFESRNVQQFLHNMGWVRAASFPLRVSGERCSDICSSLPLVRWIRKAALLIWTSTSLSSPLLSKSSSTLSGQSTGVSRRKRTCGCVCSFLPVHAFHWVAVCARNESSSASWPGFVVPGNLCEPAQCVVSNTWLWRNLFTQRVIQAKRHRALEEAKRAERLARLKEERRVRQSIIRAMQLSKGVGAVTLPSIMAGTRAQGQAPMRNTYQGESAHESQRRSEDAA